MSNPCKLANLLCKIGVHDNKQTAHWCDRECSIIFIEYTCARCGKEAWEWVHWDPDTTAIKRIPSDMSSLDAAVLAECGKVNCELANKYVEVLDKQKASNGGFAAEETPPKKKANTSRKRKPAAAKRDGAAA